MVTDVTERPVSSLGAAKRRHTTSAPLVIAAALPAMVLTGLDASSVNVTLPAIGRAFGGTTAALQWIVDAYTLMFAVWLLTAGAVSDRVGAKRVFALGLAAFTAASVVCGLSSSLAPMIAGRMLQGLSAAIMMPSSLGLVRQAFPDARERARAIALWTVGGAASTAAGPVIGGLLTSAIGWRAIFFVNVPVGVTALAMLVRTPRSPRRAASLDPAGQLTAMLTLAGVTLGVIEGGADGFGRPLVLGSLALAVLSGIGFLIVESRVAEPMVPLALFRSRTVTATTIIGFAINSAYYGLVFVLGLYFQEVLGRSAMVAGLLFLPMTGLIAVANLSSAHVASRYGKRVPIIVGQFVAALAPLALLGLGTRTGGVLLLSFLLAPLGVGLGFAIPSLISAMVDAIPAERAGMAGGVLNTSRQIGGALAIAAFGVLVGHRASFVTGLHISLLISAVLLVATAGAGFTLPRHRAGTGH
jgi:DHA2 family methylenomycin A resistance protein-like MFS transporter